MYPFFETIRIEEGKPCLLPYHQQRIRRTCRKFGIAEPSLSALVSKSVFPNEALYKWRVLYGQSGVRHEYEIYRRNTPRRFYPVQVENIDYAYKFTDRSAFLTLKEKYAPGADEDIILIKNGLITDTSFANLIFYKKGKWYTPANPLLKGVCRASLLDRGSLIPAAISPDALSGFSGFKIINAMNYPEDTALISVDCIASV